MALAILLLSSAGLKASTSICASVGGNLVLNCGFETGDFTNWTVGGAVSGGFDGNFFGVQGDLNNPPLGAPVLGPVNSGDWAAYFGTDVTQTIAPITLSQTLTGPAGVLYTISFYIDQNALSSDNLFSVTFGGDAITSVTNMAPTGGYAFETFTYGDTSVVNPVLEFSFQNLPDYFFLDDVAVTTSTPEPSGMLPGSFALGLLLLAGLRRRALAAGKRGN
jgi:hypothetical protein